MKTTIRVAGENVRVGDVFVVSFCTDQTVAQVGIVGVCARARCFDELTGDVVADPELWFHDERTHALVGPIKRSEIAIIGAVDGIWCTREEVRTMTREPVTDLQIVRVARQALIDPNSSRVTKELAQCVIDGLGDE